MRGRGKSSPPFSLFAFQDIITCVSGIMLLVTLLLALELATRTLNAAQMGKAESELKELEASVTEMVEQVSLLEEQVAMEDRLLDTAEGKSATELQANISDQELRRKQAEDDVLALEERLDALSSREEEKTALEITLKDHAASLEESKAELDELVEELSTLADGNAAIFAAPQTSKRIWLVDLSSQLITVCPFQSPNAERKFALAKGPSRQTDTSRFQGFHTWLHARAQEDHLVICIRPSAVSYYGSLKRLITDKGLSMGVVIVDENQVVRVDARGRGAL